MEGAPLPPPMLAPGARAGLAVVAEAANDRCAASASRKAGLGPSSTTLRLPCLWPLPRSVYTLPLDGAPWPRLPGRWPDMPACEPLLLGHSAAARCTIAEHVWHGTRFELVRFFRSLRMGPC